MKTAKFKVGDEAYYLDMEDVAGYIFCRPRKIVIVGIELVLIPNSSEGVAQYSARYCDENSSFYAYEDDEDLFTTKEELFNEISKRFGL